MTALRKLLKDNKKCNPFNDAYSRDEMVKLLKLTVDPEEFKQDPLRFTIGFTDFMNSFFTGFFLLVKENIASSNIPHKDFIELLFVVFNRNYIGILKRQREHVKNQKQISQADTYKFRITTLNAGIGPVDLNSALEVDIDALTYVLNYTRYFATTPVILESSLPDLQTISCAQSIAINSAYYTIIKSTYDESIWNYGHWIKKTEDPKVILDVIFPETDLLLAKKVGLIRLDKETKSAFLQLLPELLGNTPIGQLATNVARQRKKNKQLKAIKIENGYINPELIDGYDAEQDLLEIKNTIELDTFYAFLDNPILKNLNGLQLPDLVKLFSLLQDICKKAAHIEFDDGIEKLSDIQRFPIKMDKAVLYNYLEQRTDYTTIQLNTFIELISCKYGDRLNLWDRPLVQYEDDLYINYFPTLNPILLNLIDYWLDQGGFSLDERGNLLEKYLTNVIGSAITEKGFTVKIPESSKIYNNQKQFEEIDLLLNLKDVVVVGEVKCIKYPFEARDHHNALGRLQEAAEQVKRKMEFLKKYENEVANQTGTLTGKTFLPIIITNYPIYSTFKLDGVIITDFYLLESYFSDGTFTNAKIQQGGTLELEQSHVYYTNEKEMNDNLPGYLENPLAISILKEMFEIRPFKVSMDDLDYDIYVTSAQIKASDTTNIISHNPE